MRTIEWNPQAINSLGQKGSFEIKESEIRFFAQFRDENTERWIFATPVVRHYGHKTIEGCEEMIRKIEDDCLEHAIEPGLWRIVEVSVIV